MNKQKLPIDPGMLRFYEVLSKESPPEAVSWPLDQQRQAWNDVCAKFRAPRPLGLIVEDHAIARADGGHVNIRLYRPKGSELLPGVIYFHGGGWVLGSLETHDDMCAELCELTQTAIVSVDYRLAPEHRHPAQLEDNLTVLHWMRREGMKYGLDPARIIAAGDSAGGQMSASLALYLRDHAMIQLKGMVLIYPVLGSDCETASYIENADAPCLTKSDMIYYFDAWLGPKGQAPWHDIYALPLLADDYSQLPPAFITAAMHDPLMDDACAFHARLGQVGSASQLRLEPELPHSYIRARHVSPPAMAGFQAIAKAMRTLAYEHRLPSGVEE
jgi:acetyl esterase